MCLLGKNICRILSFSEHVDLGKKKRERGVVKRLGFHALIFLFLEMEPGVYGRNMHACVGESDHIRGPSRSELRGDCKIQRNLTCVARVKAQGRWRDDPGSLLSSRVCTEGEEIKSLYPLERRCGGTDGVSGPSEAQSWDKEVLCEGPQTYIQVSQETGKVVWYSHLFKKFPTLFCDLHNQRL